MLTHTQGIGGGRFKLRHSDIAAHAVLYAALTWLGARYLAARGALTVKSLLVCAVVYAGYGALDEWSQQFVGRIPSGLDWAADCTGIALVTVVLLRRRWKLSERPPTV
jgi:VanZ family protein